MERGSYRKFPIQITGKFPTQLFCLGRTIIKRIGALRMSSAFEEVLLVASLVI
jgi:hypothetical protein